MNSKTCDIAIIGGGIIGCGLAESLALEGLDVVLLERGVIGREASWAAAGMLAPQSEMEEPGEWFDFCLAARRCFPETVERLRDSASIDPQYRDEGMLYVAFNEDEERTLLKRAAWQRRCGVQSEILDASELARRESAVSDSIRMAVRFVEDHCLDPRLMTQAYAISARRAGADLREMTPVHRVLIDGDRVVGVELPGETIHAQSVVLAGGCWSGLIAGLPFALPIHPVKGQMLLLQCATPQFSCTLHSRNIYLVPRFDGRVIVGATEEHDAGFDKSVFAGAVSDLLSASYAVVPALREAAAAETWAGLRPGTPDRRPIMGPSPVEGLVLATGHFRNGILLAPLTAQLITEYIVSGSLPETLGPFGIERFGAASAPARKLGV